MRQTAKCKSFQELKKEGFFDNLEPGRVEFRIRPLVNILNQLPYVATYSSCSGHRVPPIEPYVSFYAHADRAKAFIDWLKELPEKEGFEEAAIYSFPPTDTVSEASCDPIIGVDMRFLVKPVFLARAQTIKLRNLIQRKWFFQNPSELTAEEAMKKVRKGEALTMEEHDSMTVEESMKFYAMLAKEEKIKPEVADATIKSLEVYLRHGVIGLDDTVKEAEGKIDRYWRVAA